LAKVVFLRRSGPFGQSASLLKYALLSKAQKEGFRQAIEQLQDSRGGGRVLGEDIRQLLFEQFAVAYSLNGVYDLLKRLDMAWISARSISPHIDPVKQTDFNKICPAGRSHSSPKVSDFIRSISGFRTQCAWVNHETGSGFRENQQAPADTAGAGPQRARPLTNSSTRD
jgi:hypothetical protein